MQFTTICEDGLYGQTRTDFLHLYIHGMLRWIFSDFYMYTGLCKSLILSDATDLYLPFHRTDDIQVVISLMHDVLNNLFLKNFFEKDFVDAQ